LAYDKSPEVYPEHFKVVYAKVEPMLNIFSNQAVGLKKITELEAKIQEKETVIKSLIQNGQQKATEMDELKAKVQAIESSKPALEALLKRVLELESKLSEGKK
jgi:chromosome segregation ATPase